MSERVLELCREAEAQVTTLMELVRGADPAALRRPGSGREKLGDGTVATLVAFTAANYERVAGFAAGASEQGDGHRGHHGDQAPEGDGDPEALLARLAMAHDSLARVSRMTDERLDAVPGAGSFRFCDGKRTVGDVLARLLAHQGHQVEAIATALATGRSA